MPVFKVPAPPPLVAPHDACWNCPHWQRRASAIGLCKGETHGNALTSYVHICPEHPNFRETP